MKGFSPAFLFGTSQIGLRAPKPGRGLQIAETLVSSRKDDGMAIRRDGRNLKADFTKARAKNKQK